MLKNLKFSGPDDSFWFVSDTHFNHAKLIERRGYTTMLDHDNGIIHAWNAAVKPTDTVCFLGDFHFVKPESSAALNVLRRLNFHSMYMLWGNHNASVKQLYHEEIHRQFGEFDAEVYPLDLAIDAMNNTKTVTFVGDYVETFFNDQHIILSHFSHRTWHKNGKGSWNLVGHSHGSDKELMGDKMGKVLDVGWECFQRPINLREVRTIMNRKAILITDHHDAHTT